MFVIESLTLPNQDTSWSFAAGIDTDVSVRSSNGRRATNNLVTSTDGATVNSAGANTDANDSFINQSIIGWK